MKSETKKLLIHAGIVVLFFIISAIYFAPVFQGKIIMQGDAMKYNAMVNEAKQFHESTGEYANWNSTMFSGMPAYQIGMSEPSSDIFTPVRKLLTLAPFDLRLDVGILFLYLISFYIGLSLLGVSPLLSLLGAIAFGLGSYNIIIIEAGHITKAYAISMMAPVLIGMMIAFRKKYLLGGILFTFALGLQIAFNHIQITYYTAIAGVILGVVYAIYAIREKWIKDFLICVGVLFLGAGLVLTINARHLFVNQEYAEYTMRGGSEISVTPEDLYKDGESKSIAGKTSGLDIDYAYSWSYGKGETFTILVPGLYGGGSGETVSKDSEFYKNFRQTQAPLYWGDQPFTSGPVYFGAIVMFLFVLGIIIVKGPERWWILAATILAIVMSWGKNLSGFNEFLFNYLPMYNKFRTPSMSLVIANVTTVLMAILALKTILNKEIEQRQLQKALFVSAGITGGLCLLFIIFAGSFSLSGLSDTQMAAQYGNQWQAIQDILIKDRKDLLIADSFRSLVLILLSAAMLWLLNNNKIKNQNIVVVALMALTIFDLWGVDKRYLNEKNFVNKNKIALQPTQDDLLIDEYARKNGDEDYRVFNVAVNTFNDSYPSAFHHQIGGYHAAKLRRYQDLIDFYLSQHINTDVLNMLNARYFVVPNGKGGTMIQRNVAALGNAWFVDNYKLVDDANAEILSLNDFDPATTAIINKEFGTSVASKDISRDSNSVIEMIHQKPYHPDYLKYESKTNKEQLAVFSEIYYAPDWRAYIDGKPAEYIRVNYVLRALIVPAGEHTIEFKNEAPLLHKLQKVSWVGSGIFVLVIIGAIGLNIYNKKKKSSVVENK
ncbi:MAG: hypothetical protein IKY22_07250 [Bacteroidales bacterium]|nr:hypothetical protein [Bacteroidales bacterium]